MNGDDNNDANGPLQRIQVLVTDEEKAALEGVASAATISVSALMRRYAGLEPLLRGTPKRKPQP